jgi:hypothetical protein
MDGNQQIPEKIKVDSVNDYSQPITENEASADATRAETETATRPTSEGEENGSGCTTASEVLATIERVKPTTPGPKSAQKTTIPEGKKITRRLIAGSMTPEEAMETYEQIIGHEVVDRLDLIDNWLSGREPASEDEDICFSRLDALGPEDVAYLQILLTRYDGDILGDVMVVLLEDNAQTLLEIVDAAVERVYGKTVEDLYRENQALKKRLAELHAERTAVATEKHDAD